MKKIAIMIALAATGAHAQTTITLEPTACGTGIWCAATPNDAGDSILLYGSTNYQNVGMIIGAPDGTFQDYISQSYRGYSVIYVGTCPATPKVGTVQLSSVPLVGYNGTTGASSISATFSCTSVLGGSGRAQSWHQVWNLITGQLTFP